MTALKGNPLATREGSIVEITDIAPNDGFYKYLAAGAPIHQTVLTLDMPVHCAGDWATITGKCPAGKYFCFYAAKYKVLYY